MGALWCAWGSSLMRSSSARGAVGGGRSACAGLGAGVPEPGVFPACTRQGLWPDFVLAVYILTLHAK